MTRDIEIKYLIAHYVDENFDIHERLDMMCEIKGKTSVEFAVKVISMVKDLNLPKGDVRFQYDTAESMFGHYNCAQAYLSEILTTSILYITCMGYKSNISVEDASKEPFIIKTIFATLQSLYDFLTTNISRFS